MTACCSHTWFWLGWVWNSRLTITFTALKVLSHGLLTLVQLPKNQVFLIPKSLGVTFCLLSLENLDLLFHPQFSGSLLKQASVQIYFHPFCQALVNVHFRFWGIFSRTVSWFPSPPGFYFPAASIMSMLDPSYLLFSLCIYLSLGSTFERFHINFILKNVYWAFHFSGHILNLQELSLKMFFLSHFIPISKKK